MPTAAAIHSTTSTDAHASLLRLAPHHRRHSLPASSILAFLSSAVAPTTTAATAATATTPPPSPRSTPAAPAAFDGPGDCRVEERGGNRHRYGHRHTRSEAYGRPIVVVKSYTPPPSATLERDRSGIVGRMMRAVTGRGAGVGRADDDDDTLALPGVGEFAWAGILRAVQPEGASPRPFCARARGRS